MFNCHSHQLVSLLFHGKGVARGGGGGGVVPSVWKLNLGGEAPTLFSLSDTSGNTFKLSYFIDKKG